MQNRSINRKTIDWKSFRQQVNAKAQGAQTIAEIYPAIQLALNLLGDNHSAYTSSAGELIVGTRTTKCLHESPAYIPVIPGIGYVRIPPFKGSGSASVAFADSIQAVIKNIDNDSIQGWIVDLRGNTGGDFWPMLAGIGPILGDGVAGYFVDPDGRFYSWSYQDGITRQERQPRTTVTNAYRLRQPNPKVAVLTDIATASSGEGIAISFKSRPNTRSFGTPTCGVSTGNSVFRLSDGASLILTQATMADRTKTIYGNSVLPDEIYNSSIVIGRASFWLLK